MCGWWLLFWLCKDHLTLFLLCPISYNVVCFMSMVHHGYAAIYSRNLLLLRADMLAQNISCVITALSTWNSCIPAFIACGMMVGRVFLNGNIAKRKHLVIAYSINAIAILIGSGPNLDILGNWLLIFAVFILSIKFRIAWLEIAFHLLTHWNIQNIWIYIASG